MITIPELTAQALGAFLALETKGRFGSSNAGLSDLLPYAARLALDCIGNSDALYHNVEHTMLVTLAGHDILIGRALLRPTTAGDYANFILACLVHDIGYVRGIVQGDEKDCFVADLHGRVVSLPRGASDAALAPYHVDRSKLFALERLDTIEQVDAVRIARAIEYTRVPYAPAPSNDDLHDEEGLLLRAADLIGQLGDPNYMKKSNALFYEFEEIGLNKTMGYETPADIVYRFPRILLDQCRAGNQYGHTLPQRYLKRAAMDRQSLWQCLSSRTRCEFIGPAEVIGWNAWSWRAALRDA